ncbi:hypothetical protein RCO48_18805 [Peribacillus frigoritolerans]|nr:hypothetical protein [Peribacillus frigoritolerans]
MPMEHSVQKIEIVNDYRAYLSTYFRTKWFKNYIDNMSLGTNINNINNEHVNSIRLLIPNERIRKHYEEIVAPILDKQGKMHKENLEFTNFCDWLLPILMNGQVTIE